MQPLITDRDYLRHLLALHDSHGHAVIGSPLSDALRVAIEQLAGQRFDLFDATWPDGRPTKQGLQPDCAESTICLTCGLLLDGIDDDECYSGGVHDLCGDRLRDDAFDCPGCDDDDCPNAVERDAPHVCAGHADAVMTDLCRYCNPKP